MGAIAHGGHCVVRLPPPEARVVFVRHALPGEEVLLQITEGSDGDRFWRADAVEVLSAAPDRVVAPCPYAGPDRCGGCDFQHVALAAQRELKAQVVREQLQRLAGLEVPVVVEAVPGDEGGLRWRTRMRYVDLPAGPLGRRRGLRKHRSHEVVEIGDCLIAHPDSERRRHQEVVVTEFGTRSFAVDPDGFWQVHPGAPRVLVETVLSLLEPRAGESVLDLYAGVGLFARFLADAVGEGGRVTAVEADGVACGHAAGNLAGVLSARVERGPVDRVLRRLGSPATDLVVLDPPREGARRTVVEQIVACRPRAVAYVACDPAALARDVAIFSERDYRLSALRAFDLFPMTHHVECVALLEKTGSA